MSRAAKKAKEMTSIGIAVSFDGSSRDGLKIVTVRSDGSKVMLTTLVDITKDGMTYIKDHGWNKMFSTSGAKAIVVTKENGNEQS
jgi:hypothetical protein